MSTSIDQAFIKQFECCASLLRAVANRLKSSVTVNKRVITVREEFLLVTQIWLVTVFASCATVMNSALSSHRNDVAMRISFRATHNNFPAGTAATPISKNCRQWMNMICILPRPCGWRAAP